MGTTNRRQPVSFAIPKSPDYKFLNITNFRGLDISSNPFELASNTASDCLNVYVDETNTLTTRPRLERKITPVLKWMLEDTEHIILNVQSVSNGYLIQGKEVVGDWWTTGHFWFIRDNQCYKLSFSPAINVPYTKCLIFERDNYVYIMIGEGEDSLYRFDKYVEDVEGTIEATYVTPYFPIADIINAPEDYKKPEELNLLTDRYKQLELWDGYSEPKLNGSPDYDELIKKIDDDSSLHDACVIGVYGDGSFWFYKPNAWGEKHTSVDLYHAESYDGYYTISKGTTVNFPITIHSSSGFEYYDRYYPISVSKSSGNVIWYDSVAKKYYKMTPQLVKTQICGKTTDVAMSLHVTDSENYVVVTTESSSIKILNFDGEDNTDYVKSLIKPLDSDATFTIRDYVENTTGTTAYVVAYKSKSVYGSTIVVKIHGATVTELGSIPNAVAIKNYLPEHPNDWSELEYRDDFWGDAYENRNVTNGCVTMTSPNGKYFAALLHVDRYNVENGVWIVVVYNENGLLCRTYTSHKYVQNVVVGDEGYVYVTRASTGISEMVFLNRETLEEDWVFLEYTSTKDTELNNSIFYKPGKYMIFERQPKDTVDVYQWDKENKFLSCIAYLEETDDRYDVWKTRHDKLFNAKITTRFDNNLWMASGNSYYRSDSKDASYFSMTECNELGDSTEEITGFNIANDSTLLAYKKDRVYLIQPFTSSKDTIEYTITESKNTVGNTAVGAPIVTTLTEVPIQINNDGVYGLTQVSNVSATERIADLISGPINERWLDIPEQYIANAITLNRLYWTYIIIPRRDKNLTSIYLLDNRTTSWYYWELPILTLGAFTKDDHAEFVDANGVIYYLTSTDIENKAFDTQLVTDYYDVDHRLIPWYWQSQILPLGTMNYSKRLVNTTFILTDTDAKDGYGLNYSFKVFRKLASSTPETEISGDLNLVRSYTHKTTISKFGFLQIKLSHIEKRDNIGNITEDSYRNNKLRLVGLGLKYVLLEGLIK